MSKSSTRPSFAVLHHLWHVEEADEIAQHFEDIGLGRISSDGQDDVFTLHDLQYEYCVSMRGGASRAATDVGVPMPVAASGHALFLSSCESLLLSSSAAGDDVGERWTRFCFADGGGLSEVPLRQYLARNLFRHLCGVAEDVCDDGVKRTMMSVLSDFGCLRGQFLEDGGSSAILDCTTALSSRSCRSAGSSAESRLLTGGAEKSIRALQKSLMLVGEGVSADSDGSLAGCLIQLSQSDVGSEEAGLDADFLTKLACSSEDQVRGPFFKPITGCSRTREQGVIVKAVVGRGGFLRSLAALGVGGHFVSGSTDGVVRVHESEYLGAVLELSGHTDEVNCVAVAKKDGTEDLFLLFSGSDDGKLRSWQVGLDQAKGAVEKESVIVCDCPSLVWCIAVSEGGGFVAAGCWNGKVFVWKRREEDAALASEFVTSFRCAVAGKESGCVAGVAVSRSGDFVVAGEGNGGVAFWSSGGSGSEGAVARGCASDESDAKLRHVLLSEDESSVTLVFDEPVGCEVWDIASRSRLSSRVPLSGLRNLTCASFSRRVDACAEGSGTCGVLVAGGWNQNQRFLISLHSPNDDFEVLSTYHLASMPCSVCFTSFGGDKRMLVGCDDGCVRMLDAGVPVESDGAKPCDGDPRSLGSGSRDGVVISELEEVSAVAVMPAAGLVVAGHADGRISFWRAESGEFVRAFNGGRGRKMVMCVAFSADESLAVSGYVDGVALVWDASTWKCRFALEWHSQPVVCATISADAKRIVTIDYDGELRLWDAEIGGAALPVIKTGLKFSRVGSRGAISRDGGLFLWASRDAGYKWRRKVIDLRDESVTMQSMDARRYNWDAFLKELMSNEAFDGDEEMALGFGAVYCNRIVGLGDVASGQKTADGWRISSGEERGVWNQRIDCALRSADGEAASAAASLSFDSNVNSIAAGWIPSEKGCRRRAVVACWLHGRSFPAIMHFYPAYRRIL